MLLLFILPRVIVCIVVVSMMIIFIIGYGRKKGMVVT